MILIEIPAPNSKLGYISLVASKVSLYPILSAFFRIVSLSLGAITSNFCQISAPVF